MAGRKSGKSSRAAAAPSRSSTPARTSAPSQATTTHQSQAVAPATAAPSPVTVHHTSGGGGFLSGVAQMAAVSRMKVHFPYDCILFRDMLQAV